MFYDCKIINLGVHGARQELETLLKGQCTFFYGNARENVDYFECNESLYVAVVQNKAKSISFLLPNLDKGCEMNFAFSSTDEVERIYNRFLNSTTTYEVISVGDNGGVKNEVLFSDLPSYAEAYNSLTEDGELWVNKEISFRLVKDGKGQLECIMQETIKESFKDMWRIICTSCKEIDYPHGEISEMEKRKLIKIRNLNSSVTKVIEDFDSKDDGKVIYVEIDKDTTTREDDIVVVQESINIYYGIVEEIFTSYSTPDDEFSYLGRLNDEHVLFLQQRQKTIDDLKAQGIKFKVNADGEIIIDVGRPASTKIIRPIVRSPEEKKKLQELEREKKRAEYEANPPVTQPYSKEFIKKLQEEMDKEFRERMAQEEKEYLERQKVLENIKTEENKEVIASPVTQDTIVSSDDWENDFEDDEPVATTNQFETVETSIEDDITEIPVSADEWDKEDESTPVDGKELEKDEVDWDDEVDNTPVLENSSIEVKEPETTTSEKSKEDEVDWDDEVDGFDTSDSEWEDEEDIKEVKVKSHQSISDMIREKQEEVTAISADEDVEEDLNPNSENYNILQEAKESLRQEEEKTVKLLEKFSTKYGGKPKKKEKRVLQCKDTDSIKSFSDLRNALIGRPSFAQVK